MRQTARHLRKQMTDAERTLWGYLRGNRMGYHFRRQHPLRFCVLDFYCASCRVAVEVDGGIHALRADADAQRTAELARAAIRVVRVSNEEVMARPQSVLDRIRRACDEASSAEAVEAE
jgi:very-short-patch-repair endonuclease